MPCDTVNVITVDFGKANPDLIKAAMAKLHPGVRFTINNGTLRVADRSRSMDEDLLAREVKMEMGRITVEAQAKKFGWATQRMDDGKIKVLKARL